MPVTPTFLIVEDHQEWCGRYADAAKQEGITTIKFAKDLGTASSLIDEMRFSLAFIDIGLDENDDQNIDGLHIMSKIRAMGDETSIVVVTGRTGQDVLPITRDSIMKYGAHGIVGKKDVLPAEIRSLLKTGLQAFTEKAAADPPAHKVLKGGADPRQAQLWDSGVMRSTAVTGGVNGLYDFLDQLMDGFLPVVANRSEAAVVPDAATGVMHGGYWSRASGQAIALCFGDQERAGREIGTAREGGCLLGRYDVGEPLREWQDHGLTGAIFSLKNRNRDSFR